MSPILESYSVLITGLGGQGVMLLSRIIAVAALREVKFVSRTESRGLSQRGGSVCSEIKMHRHPVSPVIRRGCADLILSLDALETIRVFGYLSAGGVIVTNIMSQPPLNLMEQWRSSGNENGRIDYDTRVTALLCQQHAVHSLDLKRLAVTANLEKSLNIVLLGAASHFLPLDTENLLLSMLANIGERHRDANKTSFEMGRSALCNRRTSMETIVTTAAPSVA